MPIDWKKLERNAFGSNKASTEEKGGIDWVKIESRISTLKPEQPLVPPVIEQKAPLITLPPRTQAVGVPSTYTTPPSSLLRIKPPDLSPIKETTLKPATKLSFWQKVNEAVLHPLTSRYSPLVASEAEQQLNAWNVWRTTKQINEQLAAAGSAEKVSDTEVSKNLIKYQDKYGVPRTETRMETVGKALTIPVAAGLLTNPITTGVAVGAFAGLTALENAIASKLTGKEIGQLSDVLPSDSPQDLKDVVDVIDMLGKGLVIGVGFRTAKKLPELKDKFTKDIKEKYKLPETVYLNPAEVRSIFIDEKGVSPEKAQLYKELGLQHREAVKAVKNGVFIAVPFEKIVTRVDKPWWAVLKRAIRIKPTDDVVSTEYLGKPQQAPMALLGSGTVPMMQAPKFVAPTQEPIITPQPTAQFPTVKAPQESITIERPLAQEEAYIENARSVAKELSKAERQMVRDFLGSEEYEVFKAQRDVKEDMRGQISYDNVLRGIKNTAHFKKEKTIRDIWGEGWIMEKNGREVLAAPDEEAKYRNLGYTRGMPIDTLAYEAGFDRGYEFLEYVLEMGATSRFTKQETIARNDLYKIDSNYRALREKIDELKSEIKTYDRSRIQAEKEGARETPLPREGVSEGTLQEIREREAGIQPEKLGTGGKAAILKDLEPIVPSGVGKASIGAFAETPIEEGALPKTATKAPILFADTPIEFGANELVRPMEMPEIVKLARQLLDAFPIVRKLRAQGRRGEFIPTGKGEIRLSPEIFEDPTQAARTLAHEIGHLIDYLPDHMMKRGNLLARLFTLRGFLRSTFTKDFPPNLFGEKPSSLDLNKIKKDAFRSTLKESGYTFGEFMQDKKVRDLLKPKIKARYDEFLADAKNRYNVTELSTVTKELKELSAFWRPWDEATAKPSFKSYRNSSEELFADALSVLLNSPGTIERMAPTFYAKFFESLDAKPEVKVEYFAIQDMLAGTPEKMMQARQDDIRAGFRRAEAIQKEFTAKRELSAKSAWMRLRTQVDDINYPLLVKIAEKEREGVFINPQSDPRYIVQELSLVDNENFIMVEKIDKKVAKPLEEAGITHEDIGEYLLLRRISTERAEIANPFGHTQKTAERQLEHLKTIIGAESFALLEKKIEIFHEIIFKSVEEAVETGSYNRELFTEKILPNKENYASFAVVDYLQEQMPATIKKQIGTLKEVANPFTATIIKTVALNRLNAFQRAKNATRDFMKEHYGSEIAETKTITTDGKLKIFKTPPGLGRIEILEDGKLVGYDVDPYIAQIFERSKIGDLNVLVSFLQKFNSAYFKPMVTTYNLGFAVAFNPLRDIRRNYKLIQRANFLPLKISRQGIEIDTAGNLLLAYAKALPSAVKFARGELDTLTMEMIESKAMRAPMNGHNIYDREDDYYIDILRKFKIIKEAEPTTLIGKFAETARRTILKPVIKLLDGVRFIADTFEVTSKIAGYSVRKSAGEEGKLLAHNVRNFTGTPNYMVKGKQTDTTNALFVFSNVMKEGMKTDFSIATNPTTRSGYWWKTIKIDLFPKFLMVLASAGLLGEEIKKFYDRIPEYDKTNYIPIPLGIYDSDGTPKSAYVRLPHDEVGRLFSSIFWKMANFTRGDNKGDWQDIFSIGAGQLPSLTPAVTLSTDWMQYLSGRNPYDAFRGRTVIDDTTWQAGGGASIKKMVQHSINELGLTRFATYDPSDKTTLEAFLQVTPLFQSLVKISNYGETEEQRRELKKEKKEAAQITLGRRKTLKEAARDISRVEDITRDVLMKAGKDIYGEDFQPAKQMGKLRTSLMREVVRKDSRVNAILSASTNDQKIKILELIKKQTSPDQYNELVKKLKEFKVIPPTFKKPSGTLPFNTGTSKERERLPMGVK